MNYNFKSKINTIVYKYEDKRMRGETDMMTSVNFQPWIKPIIIPAINDAMYWKKFPSFSPIPSLILLTSLERKKVLKLINY